MRGLKVIGVVLLAGVLSGCQVKNQSMDPVKLSGKEINAMFVSKTVESFNLISGSTSFTYYAPDGKVAQERYWEKRSGYWKINAKDEICLAMQGKPFNCRSIFLEDGRYYKYRRDAQGNLEKIIRYRQFIDGNVL